MTTKTKLPKRLTAALFMTCAPDSTFTAEHKPRDPKAHPSSDATLDRVFLKSAEHDVEFIIYPEPIRPLSKYDREHPEWQSVAWGTTNFGSILEGRRIPRTFDRIGVESSFYFHRTDTVETVRAKFAEHLTRIATQRERSARSVTVPEIGYSITPATKAQHTAALKSGSSISFSPSGFGTGYTLTLASRRRTRLGYGTRMAGTALNEFFGVGALLVETRDCD